MLTRLKTPGTVIMAALLFFSCNLSEKTNKTQTNEMLILGIAAYAVTRSPVVMGTCTFTNTSCVDYYTGWTTSQMTADCSTGSGTFTSTATACTATSRVGSCAMVGRGAGTVISGTTATVRYYSAGFTTGSAQTNCGVLPGTFSAN